MKKQLTNERNKLLSSIERLMEGPMIFLGFVWLALLLVELLWGFNDTLKFFSVAIWIIFIIDFVIKFMLAPVKHIFLKKNWLSAVSLVIPALRIFRAIRFIRLLRGVRGIRLIRVVSSINRSMKSLAATMRRRNFAYVFLLAVLVTFAGAAGLYAIERSNPGFENYGAALWWSAMRIITAGSEYFPITPEGKVLAFLIALFGYVIFGYVMATLASFFIGRDAEEKNAPLASAKQIEEFKTEITSLTKSINELKNRIR